MTRASKNSSLHQRQSDCAYLVRQRDTCKAIGVQAGGGGGGGGGGVGVGVGWVGFGGVYACMHQMLTLFRI
jgi:hypothetical protein